MLNSLALQPITGPDSCPLSIERTTTSSIVVFAVIRRGRGRKDSQLWFWERVEVALTWPQTARFSLWGWDGVFQILSTKTDNSILVELTFKLGETNIGHIGWLYKI